MTWTFNGSPDTSSTGGRRDAVRLLVPDIDSANQMATDEAIAFWLSEAGNNIYRAAAHVCRSLADATRGTAISVGDLSISGGTQAWREKAMSLDRQADYGGTPFAGGISVLSKESYEADSDRVAPSFSRKQDNIPGGPDASTRST